MTPLEKVGEVRRAIGTLALLHAGEMLDRRDMAAAVHTIELALIAIEEALIGAAEALIVDLPVLTLAEIGAEHRRRRPPLRLVAGGQPNGEDAA